MLEEWGRGFHGVIRVFPTIKREFSGLRNLLIDMDIDKEKEEEIISSRDLASTKTYKKKRLFFLCHSLSNIEW